MQSNSVITLQKANYLHCHSQFFCRFRSISKWAVMNWYQPNLGNLRGFKSLPRAALSPVARTELSSSARQGWVRTCSRVGRFFGFVRSIQSMSFRHSVQRLFKRKEWKAFSQTARETCVKQSACMWRVSQNRWKKEVFNSCPCSFFKKSFSFFVEASPVFLPSLKKIFTKNLRKSKKETLQKDHSTKVECY